MLLSSELELFYLSIQRTVSIQFGRLSLTIQENNGKNDEKQEKTRKSNTRNGNLDCLKYYGGKRMEKSEWVTEWEGFKETYRIQMMKTTNRQCFFIHTCTHFGEQRFIQHLNASKRMIILLNCFLFAIFIHFSDFFFLPPCLNLLIGNDEQEDRIFDYEILII